MPSLELQDYTGVLSNLRSAADLARKIRHMEKCTWEAAAMVRAHMAVETALEAAIRTAGGQPAQPGGGGLLGAPRAAASFSSAPRVNPSVGDGAAGGRPSSVAQAAVPIPPAEAHGGSSVAVSRGRARCSPARRGAGGNGAS